MSRAELAWFQLGFPRDLTEEAVLAALASFSGLPHRTRVWFDLAASAEGITHRLAVSKPAVELVTGSLRAAIGSLRVEPVTSPDTRHRQRLLWQLLPARAAIRTDELAAASADLLANLFPLAAGESVRLIWKATPAPRPRLVLTPEDRTNGRARILRDKLALPGLAVHGELSVEAKTVARARRLLQRACSPLRSLASPHGTLVAEPIWLAWTSRLTGQRSRYFSIRELAAVVGWPIDGPDIPGLELGAAKRLAPSLALTSGGRVLGTSDFAGIERPVAISRAAGTRGLYILGPTGTGKTSLIKNLVRDDLMSGSGLATVETNGDLIQDVLDLIPPERIQDVVLIDPTDRTHAVGFNPFAGSMDASLTADQLGELFQRLWKDYWGPRTGQLAHMGLLTLAKRPGSTLVDLPRLFLDPAFRREVLTGLDDPVGLEPDWRWFSSLPEREQATVVAPLLNKVRQFTARPSIRAIVGQAEPATSMRRIMAERKILLVNLPKGLIGSETAILLGCLILTALWQAAAERAGLPPSEREPFSLYVDEVQDFASAPIPWDEMFAQGRKYGLSSSVAHQNLMQIPKELREVILANARSRAVFALSASDAKVIVKLFEPSLSAADLQALDPYSIAAAVALDDGSTARPVTLVTPSPPEALGTAEKVRASSRRLYARPQTEIEATLRRQASGQQQPVGRVGRRPRRSA
jgi:hypothetical protein